MTTDKKSMTDEELGRAFIEAYERNPDNPTMQAIMDRILAGPAGPKMVRHRTIVMSTLGNVLAQRGWTGMARTETAASWQFEGGTIITVAPSGTILATVPTAEGSVVRTYQFIGTLLGELESLEGK